MWDLLKWLWGKYLRVYAWFGYKYTAAINVIDNIWTWVVARVSTYYEYAQAFAIALKDGIRAYARAIVQTAKNVIWNWVETAKTYAWGWAEAAKGYASAIVTTAKNLVWGWVEYAKGVAWGWVEAAKGLVWGWVESAKTAVINWAKPIVQTYPWITDVLNWLTGTKRARVDDLTGSDYPTLMTFMRDPIGTVFAILKSYFITFFCFAIAYGLGTVEATLPSWPIFGGGAGGPPGPDPGPPPPGTDKIGKPVIPLYISGYVFRPGHWAVDFGLVNGQSVFASHSGVVETIGWQPAGLGLYVTVRGSDWWTLYAHCQGADVAQGQHVTAGQRIASGDDTGMSTGPHLHFVVKYKGQYKDPTDVIDLT